MMLVMKSKAKNIYSCLADNQNRLKCKCFQENVLINIGGLA